MQSLSKTNPLVGNRASSKSALVQYLPAVVLLVAIAIDRSGLLSFSLVPVACVISLVAFSFILSSRRLIGWTVVYILTIAVTLWMRRGMWTGASGNPEALVATRALVAAAAGVLACLFAKSREQDFLASNEIIRVLDQLEISVITSDCDGWLVHVNPHADKLLGVGNAIGTPFFQHFQLWSDKGKSIRTYVDLATGSGPGSIAVNLGVGAEKSEVIPGVMLRVDIGGQRRVLTLLYPRDPGLGHRALTSSEP